MSDRVGHRVENLASVHVGDFEDIAIGLANGRDLVLYKPEVGDLPYSLQVVASTRSGQSPNIGRLSLSGIYRFDSSLSPEEMRELRSGFGATILNPTLRELGINVVHQPGSQMLSRLQHDNPAGSAATTWWEGKNPQTVHVANDRKLRKDDFSSKPPNFNEEKLEADIRDFMQLLGITERALGTPVSLYELSLVSHRLNSNNGSRRKQNKQIKREADESKKAAKANQKVTAANPYPAQLPNPDARLEQVHGIDPDSLEQLEERILVFKEPELARRYGVESSGGVLLFGEPGTGKTMLAAAIKNEISAELWQIDGPNVIEKWVGESAANARNIFDEAIEHAKKRRLLLLFDEIDTIFVSNGSVSAERIAALGEFKKALAYVAANCPNILVVATTNNPDQLDKGLIRDGRFDVKIYMPLPDDESRGKMLMGAILPGFMDDEPMFDINMSDDNFRELVNATKGFSGAAIEAILKKCRSKQFARHVKAQKYRGPITFSEIVLQINKHREQSQEY